MTDSLRATLLRWRWLVAALMALTVLVTEVTEHQSGVLDDPGFLFEILAFGLALPLAVGTALSVLAHAKSRPVQTTITSTGSTKDKAASGQQVLVVENDLLLGAGVEALLTREMDLNVLGITPKDEAALMVEIGAVQPQVVVLNEATRLMDPVNFLALFKKCPQLRMIVLVNASNNWVKIYNKQQVLLTQDTGLANIIRKSSSHPQ
ncbi:MAG: hypothetical protein ACE5GO_12115 [Anaerolineales bacterium]